MIAIKHITLGALLLLAVTSQAMAQSMLIKGASILDVVSGELIDNSVLRRARPYRIRWPGKRVPVTSGKVLDLQGHTILPGLIDMHVHPTSGGGYHGYERLKLTDERRNLGRVMQNKR